MTKVIVQHHVADYDRWLAVFTEHGETRRRYGATGHAISRDTADPNNVLVVNDFATTEGARGFAADPSLPEAMGRGGVDSAPQVWITEVSDAAAY
jgi:hypothetical protein